MSDGGLPGSGPAAPDRFGAPPTAWEPPPEPLRLSGAQVATVGVISGCSALILVCGIAGIAVAAAGLAAIPSAITQSRNAAGGGAVPADPAERAKRIEARESLETLAEHLVASGAPFGEELPEAPPADPWGRPVRWLRLTRDSGRLSSAGPDGEFGNADDISVDVER
ncbi:MAG: hypothetical protein HMLKMBBP_03017 [Planctomycetes bacterium]|nr:hypothetical protein [Planctomycetota bacterium]